MVKTAHHFFITICAAAVAAEWSVFMKKAKTMVRKSISIFLIVMMSFTLFFTGDMPITVLANTVQIATEEFYTGLEATSETTTPDMVELQSLRNNAALAANGGEIFLGENTVSNPDTGPITALNNGVMDSSAEAWNDFNYNEGYNGGYANDAIVGVTFKKAYTVNEVELYIAQDGGGCMPPVNITLQYWDGSQFVNVEEQSKITDFTGDNSGPIANSITFKPVETVKIQAVMEHAYNKLPSDPYNDHGRAVWLSEFAVYTDDELDAPVVGNNAALASYGGKMFLGDNTLSTSSPVSSLNDGSAGGAYWTDWNNEQMNITKVYPYDAIVGVNLYKAYTVDSVELFILYDGGGCYAPKEVAIQYWDGAQFVNVANQSPTNGFTGDGSGSIGNLITFTPVETTRIQAVMVHDNDTLGRAIALTQFAVYTYDDLESVSTEYTPEIPQVATFLKDVTEPVTSLNETTKDGTWKFLFESPEGIPLPDDDNQDFNFHNWEVTKIWNNVIVPGGLVMQGFDIKNNTEYFYQRKVQIPLDYANKRILIRFDAVYSNARVWIDGKYVRTHKGGFTTWDCDITDYVTPGNTVTLTVGVADIDGNTIGTWNQNGENMSDPSGASYYANHNIGGINRDVALMALSKDYIARVYTNTTFTDNTYTDADLKITTQLGMVSSNAELKIELLDKYGNKVAEDSISFASTGSAGESNLSQLEEKTIRVTAPQKWDAEHPYLYTLKTTVVVGGVDIQTSTQKVGFREITYGGAKGTDSNKVYINGKEIKLRGVCRHDVSYDLGRSTTKEQDYQEIKDYKYANINFIRTSHYPVSKYLLDACDELGIYVEEENAACWGPVNCPPEEYLNGFKELVERDRNRTCLLIWSLANESSWATPFKMEYDYIKSVDLSRPVVFSFPDTADITFDIRSVHYDSWNSTNLGDPTMPVLHDEYSPSAVHSYNELQRDLNTRNFWGETIYEFWNNVFETDGALGGSIWAAGDEIFQIPEGTTKRYGAQGHYDGPATGDGLWGVIHDVNKRLKPEAWLTKKGYSPIRLDEEIFYVSGGILTIPVRNWFDHTNFNELTLEYSVDGGEVISYTPAAILPHESGTIKLNIPQEGAKQVNLKFYSSFGGEKMMIDEFNIDLMVTTYKFVPPSETAPTIVETTDAITVSGENFSVIFDKITGLIKEGKYNDDVLITGGPYFYVTDGDFGKWIPTAGGGIMAETVGNMAVINLKGAYENGQGVEFTINISSNGIILTDYLLTTTPLRTNDLKEVGISYDIPSTIESVSWIRDAYHSVYPEGHIGRSEGTALKVREGSDAIPDQYGVKPTWDWEDDMRDFSLYVNDDPNDGIVTNDFKTMRENIWTYDVNFPGTNSRISVESDAEAAARIDVKADWELIDDRDSLVKYTGNWTERDNHSLSRNDGNAIDDNYAYSKTEKYTNDANATCEFTFTGTGVSFISSRESSSGWLNVYIDGALKKSYNALAGMGQSKKRVIYSINGLTYGEHTIKIVRSTGTLVVDAFGVLTKNPTDQVSRLIVNEQWYYRGIFWGSYSGVPGQISNGSKGSATIRLTNTDNLIPVESEPIIIAVTDITGVPATATPGTDLTLTGTVVPDKATAKNIVWRVKSAGTTGATISGHILRTTATGNLTVTATIVSGTGSGDFTKDFTIVVRNNVALMSNGSEMFTGPNTETEPGRLVTYLNNGLANRNGGYWTDFDNSRYNSSYPNDAIVGVTFKQPYAVNAVELFVLADSGGCYAPSKITIQYWNGAEYVNVTEQSQTSGFTGNVTGSIGNLITFELVNTTKIRAVMEHVNDDQGRAVALTEFVVYQYEQFDTQAPVITINEPVDGATYVLKQIVDADWTAEDAISGIESSSDNGIDTSTIGSKIFMVTATDNAGNTAVKEVSYQVVYSFSGVLPPFNPNRTNSFKLGRTIPVEFRLMDAEGDLVTDAAARIYIKKISDNVEGTENEGESTSAATEGNLFRYDGEDEQYIFNLSTKSLTQGTYQINIDLGDGTINTIIISLR